MRSFFCLSLLFYQRLFLSQDRCDNRSNGVDIRFCSHKSKLIYLCISHKQLDTTRKMQKEKRPSHIDFVRRSQPLSLLRRQLPYRGEPLAKRKSFTECQGLSSIGATTTTAASGGNRESLLGPRPARRKQSAADAGCRNPGSGSASALTERLLPLRKNDLHRKEPVLALCGQGTFILLNDAVGHFDGVMGGTGVGRLRRAVGADDVHHHEALPGTD